MYAKAAVQGAKDIEELPKQAKQTACDQALPLQATRWGRMPD